MNGRQGRRAQESTYTGLLFGHLERQRFARFAADTVVEAGLHCRLPMADLVRSDLLAGDLRRWSFDDMVRSEDGPV